MWDMAMHVCLFRQPTEITSLANTPGHEKGRVTIVTQPWATCREQPWATSSYDATTAT